nr:hypothetical protein [Holophaga foetida]
MLEYGGELPAPSTHIKLLDDDPPAWLEDTVHLRNGTLGLLDVVEGIHAEDGIKGRFAEGYLSGAPTDPVDRGVAGAALQHGPAGVKDDDFAHGADGGRSDAARAAADVKNSLVRSKVC